MDFVRFNRSEWDAKHNRILQISDLATKLSSPMNYMQISKLIKENFLKPLETYEIKNVEDLDKLHDKLIKVKSVLLDKDLCEVIPHYRGEQNYGWDISSGIYRSSFLPNIDVNKARELEEKGTIIFKNKVIENYGEDQIFKHSVKPFGEKWDLLFQAQHAGIKTNLIDFSTLIDRSAFFMCEPSKEYDKSDGQLWGLLVPSKFIYNESDRDDVYPDYDPYNLNSSFICNIPSYMDDIGERNYQLRLFRQHGRLFASKNSDINIPLNKRMFWKDMMFRVRVPAEVKRIIYTELKDNGIDREKMMGLESDQAKNMIEEINYKIKDLGNKNQK